MVVELGSLAPTVSEPAMLMVAPPVLRLCPSSTLPVMPLPLDASHESALAKPFGEWLTDATGVTHAGLPLANLAIGTNGGLSANSWQAPNGITGNVLLGRSLDTGGATLNIAGSLTVGANEPSATTITRGGLKLDTTRLTRDQGYLPGGSCTSAATPQPVAMKWSRYL